MEALAEHETRTARSYEVTLRFITNKVGRLLRDIQVTEQDCGAVLGLHLTAILSGVTGDREVIEPLEKRISGRVAAQDVKDSAGEILVRTNQVITAKAAAMVAPQDLEGVRVRIRSVLDCESERGVCAMCYGCYPGTDSLVNVGENVGVLAAESIAAGLRMVATSDTSPRIEWARKRRFHLGEVSGGGGGSGPVTNLLVGLPRLVQLFEARKPWYSRTLALSDGVVKFGNKSKRGVRVEIVDESGRGHSQVIPITNWPLRHLEGTTVAAGEALASHGQLNPHDVLYILGEYKCSNYLVSEFQDVFTWFGAMVPDEHLELLLRRLICWVRVENGGDTRFAVGDIVLRPMFRKENERVTDAKGKPALAYPALLGLSNAVRLWEWQNQS